ncbi:peptidase [Devosia pacifica]|uniref:Peptidase n=1 Tax=Devosia pacifica TaxID=1335967 RepID=A0A918VWA9_9HYPH|nr:NlpC/P60 family protein [Devosia pacifica]GHA29280.1 peptidase [Devosia pacifica]
MSADRVVTIARRWLGTPYRHRAATRGAGCDCLGLLRGVWRELYGSEPLVVPPYRVDLRDTEHAGLLQEAAETLLDPADHQPRAGDVVLFQLRRAGVARHCGILVGTDRFIHAQERLGVIEANLGGGWGRRIHRRYSFPS